MRDLGHPAYDAIEQDCDWRGNDIDVFWNTFAVEAKARGSMLLLVDMPRTLPYTLGEQLQQRKFPYFVMIAPERVIEYELDEQGRFDIVVIRDYDKDQNPIWRVWTKEAWWIQRPGAIGSAGAIIEEGAYSIGVNPVIMFTEAGDFPCYGDFAQIAELSRRYFNCASERDEILRSQTFSLLTYQVPPDSAGFDVGAVAEAIGTNNMLIYNGEGPSFIAPDSGPAQVYGEVMTALEENIRRVSMTVEQPTQTESGVALTIRFQELNGALTAYARRMEDLERRSWDVVSRWLGIAKVPKIQWSKSFELSDITTELSILQQMQMSAFPQEVVQQQQKTVIGLQFSNSDQDIVDELMNAVDLKAKEDQAEEELMKKQMADTLSAGNVDNTDHAQDTGGKLDVR
jgi:hypothetical protein